MRDEVGRQRLLQRSRKVERTRLCLLVLGLFGIRVLNLQVLYHDLLFSFWLYYLDRFFLLLFSLHFLISAPSQLVVNLFLFFILFLQKLLILLPIKELLPVTILHGEDVGARFVKDQLFEDFLFRLLLRLLL